MFVRLDVEILDCVADELDLLDMRRNVGSGILTVVGSSSRSILMICMYFEWCDLLGQ